MQELGPQDVPQKRLLRAPIEQTSQLAIVETIPAGIAMTTDIWIEPRGRCSLRPLASVIDLAEDMLKLGSSYASDIPFRDASPIKIHRAEETNAGLVPPVTSHQ